MKRFMSLALCGIFLLCGYVLATPLTTKSPTSETHVKKHAVKIKKGSKELAAKKNTIKQKAILKKMGKDLTIKKSHKNTPEPSPRDVHPSNQF